MSWQRIPLGLASSEEPIRCGDATTLSANATSGIIRICCRLTVLRTAALPLLSAALLSGALAGCSPKISVGSRDSDGHPTELVRMAAARNRAGENGLRMAEAGDYRGAAQAFREAVRQEPDDDNAYFNLGLMLEKLGDYRGARDAYRRAGEIDNRTKYLEAQLRAQSELIRINNRTAEAFAGGAGAAGAGGDIADRRGAAEDRFRLKPPWDRMNRPAPPVDDLRLPDETVPAAPGEKPTPGEKPKPHPRPAQPQAQPTPPGPSESSLTAKPTPARPTSPVSSAPPIGRTEPQPSELRLDPKISPVAPMVHPVAPASTAKPATSPPATSPTPSPATPPTPPPATPPTPPPATPPTPSTPAPAARRPQRVLILPAARPIQPGEWEAVLARAAEDVEWQLLQRGRVALVDRADLSEELVAAVAGLAPDASADAVAPIGRRAGATLVVLVSAELTKSPEFPNRLDGRVRARLISVGDSVTELPALAGSGSAAGDAPDSVARTAVGRACEKLAELLPTAVADR